MVPYYECLRRYGAGDTFYVEMWNKTVRVNAVLSSAKGLELRKGQEVICQGNRTYIVEEIV